MIKYNLECECGETFVSWFSSSNEHDVLLRKKHISEQLDSSLLESTHKNIYLPLPHLTKSITCVYRKKCTFV